ncbi:MAG: MFS transporter, partial [Blastocatellia bacterium]
IIAGLLLSGLFALLPFGSHVWFFVVVGILVGAVGGSLYPVGLSMIGSLVSFDRLGAATSLFSLAFGLGSLLGPSVSGLAMSHLGDNWLFYFPSVLTALFALESIVVSAADSRSAARKSWCD